MLASLDPSRPSLKAARRFAEQTQAQIDLVNAALETDNYRALALLEVQIPPQPHLSLPSPPLSPDGAARPVEVLYHGGHFVARVPGLQVLISQPHPEWLVTAPEHSLDSSTPNLLALVGDRPSGVALVMMNHESASCMSDPTVYSAVLELPDTFFAEVERRRDNARRLVF